MAYAGAAPDGREIGIVLYSIETGKEICTSFDVVTDVGEHGELLICTQIETGCR
jgi:hypothetical protein